MMTVRAPIGVLVVGLSLGAGFVRVAHSDVPRGGAAAHASNGPSLAVYPRQSLPLSFSHVRHLDLPGVVCKSCHEGVARQTAAWQIDIPSEATCTPCHAVERDQPAKDAAAGQPPARCSACHPGYGGRGAPIRVVIPMANLKFNHNLHGDRGVDCEVCHGDFRAQKIGLATREQLPRMALCLGCHDGKKASDRCVACHVAEPGGFVKTDLFAGRLIPGDSLGALAHGVGFRTDHAGVAKTHSETCNACHKTQFCVECHNGVAKPLDFHGGDYVSTHRVDALRASTDCSACHRLQTFCVGCHARSGVDTDRRVSQFDRASSGGPNVFHPGGWFSGNDRGMRRASHHSFAAQRNVRSCVSCHRETFCMECHSSTLSTVAIDPHPAGFAGSRLCRALVAKNQRVCLKCHRDPLEAVCR